jgi:PKD repeat protein
MKRTILLFAMVLMSSVLLAQNYTSTLPQDKNAILEEFTGVRCPNCPAGHQIAASILADNPGRAFMVAYHPTNSSYTTPYSGDPDLRRVYPDVFYSTPYCGSSRFMPSAFINRRQYSGERIQSRAQWTPYCNAIMAEASPANMGMSTSYDAGTQNLNIIVEIYYTADMPDVNHIYVMLSENDIVTQTQSGASGPYTHKHTFREAFVAQWGDPITDPTTQGSLITLEYNWDATGSGYIMENCEVLAFIENQSDGEIITGVGVLVGESTAIAPMAGFTVEDNTVGVGTGANFSDASTGNPTEWEWTFDGGEPSSSNLQTPPTVIYNTPGQYTVELMVANSAGTNTLTMNNFIDVDYPPVADFSADQTMILEGESVTFTDLSTDNPTSWDWFFEGGTPATSSLQNPPEIVYNTPGIYTVTLTVANDYGESSMIEEDFIHVGGLGIYEEAAQKAFSIYPNPAKGKLFVEARTTENIEEIRLIDVKGQKVLHHSPDNGILQSIDLTTLETGLYFVEIRTSNDIYLEKVLIK